MEGTSLHHSGSCLQNFEEPLIWVNIHQFLKKGLCSIKLRLKIGNVCHKRAPRKIIVCLKLVGITEF